MPELFFKYKFNLWTSIGNTVPKPYRTNCEWNSYWNWNRCFYFQHPVVNKYLNFSSVCDFYAYEFICLRLYISKLAETFRSEPFRQLKTNAAFVRTIRSLHHRYAKEISNEISICGSFQWRNKIAIFVTVRWEYFTCSGRNISLNSLI